MGSLTSPKLLVVDLNKEDMKPGSSSWLSACKDIRQALENHGCFVALHDTISPQLRKSIFEAVEALHDLPTEIKVKNVKKTFFNGYVAQLPSVPLLEGLGIDHPTTLEGAQSFTNLMWPNGNDSFLETVMTFAKKAAELEQIVTRMLFESLGVGKYADSHIESTDYLLRLLKYRVPETGETTVGAPTHTDKTFITLLFQNHVSGLETMTKDGEWIHVEFPPSSFVVMAGDACQAWSNDNVLSPKHKVIMNETGMETRYTIKLFSILRKMVEVPEELVNEEHPLKYRPFFHADLCKVYEDMEYGRRTQNFLKDFCGV